MTDEYPPDVTTDAEDAVDLLVTDEAEPEVDDGLDPADETASFRYSITSYGADYPVDSLVKRLKSGDIAVPAFQRAYVWSLREASRFVESLLLGLPVPGVFLAKEDESNRLLVIDGQQRLRTLEYFYGRVFDPSDKRFALINVDPRFNGKAYDELEDGDRRNLDDSIIHATVIRQDVPSDDSSSIYHVFERLNNGGKMLYPQEIRAALYHGDFNELLQDLNSNQDWRSLFGATSKRLRDQELILRFLALRYDVGTYERPLKEFLNRFMKTNQHLDPDLAEEMRTRWAAAIGAVTGALGRNAFKPRGALNSAIMDAFLVALSEAQETANPSAEEISRAYGEVTSDPEFQKATARHTSDEDVLTLRMEIARRAFSSALSSTSG